MELFLRIPHCHACVTQKLRPPKEPPIVPATGVVMLPSGDWLCAYCLRLIQSVIIDWFEYDFYRESTILSMLMDIGTRNKMVYFALDTKRHDRYYDDWCKKRASVK